MNAPRSSLQDAPLFTGASLASRGFELIVALGAAVLGISVVLHPFTTPPTPLATWPLDMLVVAAGIAGIAIAGAFPFSFGHKMYLSLGSGIIFGLLLGLPPVQGLAIAFAGTLAGQLLRRARGYRLTIPTVVFNQAQYVVTWVLVLLTNARLRLEPLGRIPHGAWLGIAGAGVVYLFVNPWLVSTWTALRRRAWAFDVWVRFLREAGPGFAIALGIGALIAVMASTHPMLVLPIILAISAAHWGVARLTTAQLNQITDALAAMVEGAEQRSFDLVEHSERVAWWSERLARHLGVAEGEADAIAIAAKLHDIGKVALGIPIGDTLDEDPDVIKRHLTIASKLLKRVPGLERSARYLWSQAEWYDGCGNPDGLVAGAIPLASRIIAVADAYDLALARSQNASEKSLDHALDIVRARSGAQFDPKVVTALEALVAADATQPTTTITGTPAAAWRPDRSVTGLAFAREPYPSPLTRARHGWGDQIHRIQALYRFGADGAAEIPRRAVEPLPSPLHLIDRQEWERRRIARELHDDIGGDLTGLKCALEMAVRLPPDQLAMKVHEAQNVVGMLHTKVRNIALDLRPAILDDDGLVPALERHVERYQSLTGIHVELISAGLEHRLPEALETAAFRIIQEALTNVVKYARVTEVTVCVRRHRRILSVLVEDLGAGFDVAGVRVAGATSGLADMRERAALLGGSFTVTSVPGAGTRVEAHLPIS